MKTIKNYILVGAVLMTTGLMAQDSTPKFEEQGDLIRGTFYYEDGSIKQEGTYKDGELHGEWVSYDQSGRKSAIAQYEKGIKSGKWYFWNKNSLTEVQYNMNIIAQVTEYKSNGRLAKN